MRQLPNIYINQDATVTRLVLHIHYAAGFGYMNAVVRIPDTDIFVMFL